MSVRLQWQGMNEFKEALRKLPQHLADEAADIVIATAQNAAQTIRTNYPTGPTGNLKRRVTVSQERALVSTAAKVTSRAPHAFIFEKGTGRRQTRRGANRGRMPAAPEAQAFIPAAIRARSRMVQALKAMLVREGFLVSE